MRLFTWNDVEIELKKRNAQWPASWKSIDVYSDEVIIFIDPLCNNIEENETYLKSVFEKYFDGECIRIEFTGEIMNIVYEEADEDDVIFRQSAPLFKDPYSIGKPQEKISPLPGVPIIAAHSYKGGVGRTLSLISLAKEISEKYEDKKKILIVDADVEAPGLTWMLSKRDATAPISYLDILSVLYYEKLNDRILQNITDCIKRSTFVVETERLEVEQYFLPVYREKTQIMTCLSTPEKIIEAQSNKYIITETFSKIGQMLGADLVLVDLRAGTTEYSAPFLFDPRVQKIFISSTSLQSVKGTRQILDEVDQKVPGGLLDSRILLTMIPLEMEENTISSIEDVLADTIEKEMDMEEELRLREEYLIRVSFDNSFASLGTFSEICRILRGKDLSRVMSEIAEGLFEKDDVLEAEKLSVQEINDTLGRLNDIATQEITAEGSSSSNMLSTTSIREIVRDYKTIVPQLVVIGAKGSGKTYIYKQLIAKKTWGDFVKKVEPEGKNVDENVFILPLISSVNSQNIHEAMQNCIKLVNDALPDIKMDLNAVNTNYNNVAAAAEQKHLLSEWTVIWEKLITKMLSDKFGELKDIDAYLYEQDKKIVFLVDGLEDLFMDTQAQKIESWKFAIRALCQNVVNDLRNLPYGNIGIVVFARKDMVEDAIEINYEQFRNQYSKYELKWTPTEALRLALWIAAQANSVFGDNIDILKSSREVLEGQLELLWGKKLGRKDSREAISARWIIAALSDFTGQLQARDIVRFLKFASHTLPESKLTYRDRFIMPSEIRRAIPDCSTEKYNEIKVEMKTIYSILKKFEKMEGDKELPLTLDKISLTGEEIARLESQGYLIMADKKYYLPEIIRFALGFKYKKGARPKVLSLLSK